MERQEIGRFYAASFDGKIIEFIVYDDKTMDCPTLNIKSFKRIELKPRFLLIGDNLYYKYNAPVSKANQNSHLIGEYDIDDRLFYYLRNNRMIIYSNDMALLYGFKNKKGFDYNEFKPGSPYKWAKKKGPILVKQRKGQFN